MCLTHNVDKINSLDNTHGGRKELRLGLCMYSMAFALVHAYTIIIINSVKIFQKNLKLKQMSYIH